MVKLFRDFRQSTEFSHWILRSIIALALGTIACCIVFLESHAYAYLVNEDSLIFDVGFEAMRWVHDYLHSHYLLHDCLALINTLGLCTLVIYTMIQMGYIERKPAIVLVQIGIFVVRLVCGCGTKLPYSKEYFASKFDLPDILGHVLDILIPFKVELLMSKKHCHFVSFFSGHVALVNLLAVHFYQAGKIRNCIICHILNGLQIIRFLATRGHYTIDIIGGIIIGCHAYTYVSPLDTYLASRTFVNRIVRPKQTKQP